jgi:hypothetical protein
MFAYGNQGATDAARQQVISRFGGDQGRINDWINSFGQGGQNNLGANAGAFDTMQGLYSKYGMTR